VGAGVGIGVDVGFGDEAGGAEGLGLELGPATPEGLVPLVEAAAFADSANHVQETPRGPVSASR